MVLLNGYGLVSSKVSGSGLTANSGAGLVAIVTLYAKETRGKLLSI
jgi:hypothetical protein